MSEWRRPVLTSSRYRAVTVGPETTLRDALSALLGSSVMLGVVVDERERVIGLVSVESISDRLRKAGSPT